MLKQIFFQRERRLVARKTRRFPPLQRPWQAPAGAKGVLTATVDRTQPTIEERVRPWRWLV